MPTTNRKIERIREQRKKLRARLRKLQREERQREDAHLANVLRRDHPGLAALLLEQPFPSC